MSEIEEGAKAITAIAETTKEGLTTAQKMGAFISRVLGPAAEEAGAILGDYVAQYRQENLLKLRDRWEAIMNRRRLEGKAVPLSPKHAVPLIEAASLEDDPTIQELWAGLLANAMDPETQMHEKKIFIDLLSKLEPLEARILGFLARQGWKMHRNPGPGINTKMIEEATSASTDRVRIALQNLHRLGLLVDEFELESRRGEPPHPYAARTPLGTTSFGLQMLKEGTSFRPSNLGFALLKACASEPTN